MKTSDSISSNAVISKAAQLAYPLLAPLLFGIYPALYSFTRNAAMVNIASLGRVIGAYTALVVVLYGIFLLVYKRIWIKAANAATAALLFFNIYGIIYLELGKSDLFRVEHLTLLPLFILLAGYAVWFSSRLKKKNRALLWRGVMIVFSILTVLTILAIIPREVKKARVERISRQAATVTTGVAAANSPDIYYLIFDEFSGFEAMRQYFKTAEVEPFKAFLEDNGFWVAENAFASSNHTVHQMSVRMNFTEYPYIQGDQPIWYAALVNSRGVELLKSKGYTTVVYEEISMMHPALPDFNADYLYKYNYSTDKDLGILFDEFGMLVADNTMLLAFDDLYRAGNPGEMAHLNFLRSVQEDLAHMEDVPSPRFVYAHLMIPHQPFIFNSDGSLVDSDFYRNWNYYEGQYIYSMRYIEELVTGILENADPARPPVIIVQSDHGARIRENNLELKGFPQNMLRNILFAMYLPGADTSTLTQDENPANTLPIVFNQYLGEQIELLPSNPPAADQGE